MSALARGFGRLAKSVRRRQEARKVRPGTDLNPGIRSGIRFPRSTGLTAERVWRAPELEEPANYLTHAHALTFSVSNNLINNGSVAVGMFTVVIVIVE